MAVLEQVPKAERAHEEGLAKIVGERERKNPILVTGESIALNVHLKRKQFKQHDFRAEGRALRTERE